MVSDPALAAPHGVYRVAPSRLEGRVVVSGAKNSALRLLAASLLTDEPVVLQNFPHTLLDAQVHVGMLEALGKRCTASGDTLTITEPGACSTELVWDGRSIRNTLLILGALTARHGRGSVPSPGGCDLGDRKYDLHQQVLETLGAAVEDDGERLATVSRGPRLVGGDVHLRIRSTGATENAILAASLAEGATRIWNPHVRPEILDLIAMLRRMGARIEVHGQEHIAVAGVEHLHGVTHEVIADNVEAMTWLVGAVITDGDVEIARFPHEHLEIPLIHLRESGARLYRDRDALIVRGGRPLPVDIATGPYPGINSDMQPLFATYGAFAHGLSHVTDLRFPGRYRYAEELARMGVESDVDSNLLTIRGRGGAAIHGGNVTAHDLRAGIAVTLAGWGAADGATTIQDAWQVERGYDRFVEKARALGAHVERA